MSNCWRQDTTGCLGDVGLARQTLVSGATRPRLRDCPGQHKRGVSRSLVGAAAAVGARVQDLVLLVSAYYYFTSAY